MWWRLQHVSSCERNYGALAGSADRTIAIIYHNDHDERWSSGSLTRWGSSAVCPNGDAATATMERLPWKLPILNGRDHSMP